ncbi:MAG: hypothetical protein KDH96_10000, partial [Candidatus Riesia sp.]|nr:hypothetical protein [Candidatus Riesia sp.]
SLLLPAMYFLSSTNERTRGLRYRPPQVAMEKYSAINFNGNECLEFRIFDTCYDNVVQVLDNVVVMANTMKYWKPKFVEPRVTKIASSVMFGTDGNDNLTRFYQEEVHLDLLNAGLNILKPEYMSIKDIKEQRNFKVTKHTIRHNVKLLRDDAVRQYSEYEQRFAWSIELRKIQTLETLIAGKTYNAQSNENMEEIMNKFKEEAEIYAKEKLATKKSLTSFVQETVDNQRKGLRGKYTLAV